MNGGRFLPSKRVAPIRSCPVDHCFVYQHRCPLNGAFFIFRYISFNPRVVQRLLSLQILRGESYFALSRSLPGPAYAEILRLREDATSHNFELKRRIRADSMRTTMYRKYSAFLKAAFLPGPTIRFNLKSESGNTC